MNNATKTKIIATVGPGTATEEKIEALIKAGANTIRINSSHETEAIHRERIATIRKVSEKLGASQQKIDILKKAIDETQFKNALKMTKDAIPESLLINGHSPILLLHSALSEGVHSLSDEQCLELAGSIRIVLGELSERLTSALKDEAELTKALSTLMNR